MSPNVIEWKLVDVPELGYFTTDKPFPRGELVLKTKTMISGYYKHQDVGLLAFAPAGSVLRITYGKCSKPEGFLMKLRSAALDTFTVKSRPSDCVIT